MQKTWWRNRASDLGCARAIDTRFIKKKGARLFKVMGPLDAFFLVMNES